MHVYYTQHNNATRTLHIYDLTKCPSACWRSPPLMFLQTIPTEWLGPGSNFRKSLVRSCLKNWVGRFNHLLSLNSLIFIKFFFTCVFRYILFSLFFMRQCWRTTRWVRRIRRVRRRDRKVVRGTIKWRRRFGFFSFHNRGFEVINKSDFSFIIEVFEVANYGFRSSSFDVSISSFTGVSVVVYWSIGRFKACKIGGRIGLSHLLILFCRRSEGPGSVTGTVWATAQIWPTALVCAVG